MQRNLVNNIESYNGLIHRGIGMSLIKAVKEEDWEIFRGFQERYRNECLQNKQKRKKFIQVEKF